MNSASLTGCLLGGALGDSLGLPYEGLRARRIAALAGAGPLRQRFICGFGMLSDDTEHAAATLLSLRAAEGDPERFARDLACRLRWWFAGIPAGIGSATARSILKLWCGISPQRSGVFSAGNGPLMRAGVIGVYHAPNAELRTRFVTASTLITHSDPRALECALMIAECAACACLENTEILPRLHDLARSEEMRTRLTALTESLAAGHAVATFADRIGRRPGFVSGFAPDTAAVSIYAWLHHRGDFAATLEAVIRAGGDTDTTAFVAGSLAGIDSGPDGLPPQWLASLRDWPLSVAGLRRMASGESPAAYPLWPLSLPRNAAFFLIVLCHAFRRMLPPFS